MSTRPPTLHWEGGIEGCLKILDQRLLPAHAFTQRLEKVEDVWQAIKELSVRGAPAIGVAAAYGLVLAVREIPATSQSAVLISHLRERGEYLKSARPTAVNLEWAVRRMVDTANTQRGIGVRGLRQRLLKEAKTIHEEDEQMCLAIGRNGVHLIKPAAGILTHCNAGSLATSDHGTALSPLYEAHRKKIPFRVYADETRPLFQGSRLTAWELNAAGIDVTLICDNMAASVMQQKKVDLVIVGADRIARNGDTANKIGTYSVALAAKAHGIPFYVAAPVSTFDLSLPNGSHIPIEERAAEEITHPGGKLVAPVGVKVYNPAFDVTPAELIAGIITDKGIISPVNARNVRQVLES
jgi:methylthioribose-1-phosphate isomerase